MVGRPGDRLEVRAGAVYVNGSALSEPYVAEKPQYDLQIRDYRIYVKELGSDWTRLDPGSANVPPKSDWTAPDRIPPNCFMMFGDNRNNSVDSHVWGFAQDTGHSLPARVPANAPALPDEAC